MSKSINVIGAGVVGLTTALLLQQSRHRVTVISKHLPGDQSIEYTSPWAGAHWRTLAPNNDKKLQEYDAVSYKILSEFARDVPNAGVMFCQSFDYHHSEAEEFTNPWWKDLVMNFHFIPKDELLPDTNVGHKYTTVTINTPKYLRYLLDRFTSLGGNIRRASLAHIRDAIDGDDSTNVVVNCTGLMAKFLGGVEDQAMYPTRGQTVIVEAPHVKTNITKFGSDYVSYIIPRDNGEVVLGGTMQKNDFTATADPETAKDIMRRVCEMYPELTKGEGSQALKVLRDGVGLRPSREGGPRIETETLTTPHGKTVLICHNYGHGGFGYQSSWGASADAVNLVHRGLAELEGKQDAKHLWRL
ncbi:FAD dependent oxidoreductase [Endogone sp. FLAS-F59071]|nr:FAD dependent oxidoreductase [Endogone sp. FLAS-F59071]|eukprot:RUS16278.1 FAD dependent oxidoreductase [Endogone sp. FLAS-F59071]